MEIKPFSQAAKDRTRTNCFKLRQGRFRLNLGKKFLHQKNCKALAQVAQDSDGVTTLKVFKTHVDVALKDMV